LSPGTEKAPQRAPDFLEVSGFASAGCSDMSGIGPLLENKRNFRL